MVMEHAALMQDLTNQERLSFQTEFAQVRKKGSTAVLLTLFLGGFGAHRYYLEQIGLGVLYTVFFWTLIPGMVAFVELFMVSGRVRRYSAAKAEEIKAALLAIRPNQDHRTLQIEAN